MTITVRTAGRSTIIGILILAVASAATAQTRKPVNDEWDQVKPLFKLVEEVAAGKPAPSSDLSFAWQCHFLNAEAGVVLVPFTLKIEKGAFSSFPLAMYLRVVAHGAPAPAPGPKDPLAQYPFEDAAMVDPPADGRISRAFTAPAGEYDVYVALAEKPDPLSPGPRTIVHKQTVHVPDLKSAFAVSSVIVADKIAIDPGNRRLNFEQQLDEPYALWGNRITPAFGTTYKRTGKVSLIFLIYNAALAAEGKPDVEVQYDVYRRDGNARKFVTKTSPELFNMDTLPHGFSAANGDVIIAGRQLPLARFADGDYQLKIIVTDKIAKKSLTRDVDFTVAGP